jgi:hypothetical protein
MGRLMIKVNISRDNVKSILDPDGLGGYIQSDNNGQRIVPVFMVARDGAAR